jgi:ferredoxin-NADP reductase
VVRHLDDARGFLDAAAVRDFAAPARDGDAYVCGPEPFMNLVESSLPGLGRVFTERFGGAALSTLSKPPSPVL